MVGRVSARVREIEDPRRSVGAPRRSRDGRNRYGEIVEILVGGAGDYSNVGRNVQIDWSDEMMGRNKQISDIDRQTLSDFSVNLEAGLFGIRFAFVPVHDGSALESRLVGRECSLVDEGCELRIDDVERNRPRRTRWGNTGGKPEERRRAGPEE